MMKKLSCFLLAVLLYSCDKDKAAPVLPVDCVEMECPVEEEFHGVGLMNGACWAADGVWIDTFSRVNFTITLGRVGPNDIEESLLLTISRATDMQDTIWLGWRYSNHDIPNIVNPTYFYREGHSVAGSFRFSPDSELTYQDFLLIDDFNTDTTIVEGRFQVRFPKRSVSNFVTHAPDTMNIRCGKFRAKAF